MSIYIKDMKKPENCWACPCYNDEYGKCQIEGNWEKGYVYDATPDWCPLVHVPEHGDLIDRVAFREEMDKHYPFDKYTQSNHGWEDSAKSAVIKILATAPTIIPADPVKEETE